METTELLTEAEEKEQINARLARIVKGIVSENAEKIILASKLKKSRNAPAAIFNVPIPEMEGKSRKTEVSIVRHTAIAIIKELTAIPLKGIGRQFGGRDHSTIINANRIIKDMRYTVGSFNVYYVALLEKCRVAVEKEKS